MEGNPMLPDRLMSIAKNKYLLLVQTKQWNAPSPEQEKIMALESKLAKVEKRTQLQPEQPRQRPRKGHKTNKSNDNNKEKTKYPRWLRKQTPPAVDKLTIPRKAPNCTGKQVNYYWCHNDTGGHCGGKWRQHKPSECIPADVMRKRRAATAQKNMTDPSATKAKVKFEKDPKQRSTKKLKIAKAVSAIMAGSDTDSADSA